MINDNNNQDEEIYIFEGDNPLRGKLGLLPSDQMEGQIDPEAIKQADALIQELCQDCSDKIGKHLEEMEELWAEMKEMGDTPKRKKLSEQIFVHAHEIKNWGAMCDYPLSAFFAESLRDYIHDTELSLEAQRVIIQAHVDALHVVNKQGLRDEEEPLALELKEQVQIAVEKYS